MTVQLIDKENIVTEAMLFDLPQPVQRYMRYTGVVGKRWIDAVRLRYRGEFRMAADKAWLPMQAEQVYTTNPPGFQWNATFKMFGLPLIKGQDTYKDGQGHMFGKLARLFTIFDASDDKLLQGTMVRYLQEMMWFPVAYLSDYITWHEVDDHAADVTYTDGEKQVRGRMYFDEVGRVVNFSAERYRENQGEYTFDRWETPVTDYETLAGLQLPTAGSGVWKLAEGDFTYIKLRITEVEYNVPIQSF